ncbi:MAG: tetratricopeptide repeat protein [Bacteroidota bacterium]
METQTQIKHTPNYEKVKQLFDELKKSSETTINTSFVTILEFYPLLSKDEKEETAVDFYKWTEANAALQPQKFPYGKYILALNAFFQERYEEALVLATDTQKLFAEQNVPDGVALCATILGSVYRPLGNVDLALKSFWEAYEQLKKSGIYQHNLMACSYQIASIYVEMQNYTEALPLFMKTLETAEKLQNPIWIINALHGLGKVYLAQKKYPETKETLEKAMAHSTKTNIPLFVSSSLTDLANFYSETGNWSQAVTLHTEALAIREKTNYLGGAVTNCIQLGKIYLKEAKQEEALAILNKGLKMAEQLKLKPKAYQIHLILSEVYQTRNELEKSLSHYKMYHQLLEQVELEDNAKKIKNLQLVFTAEQTKKENIIIKKQKAEIEQKNAELTETIDELTRTRVGKKAKAFTLAIAIALFLLEEVFIHFVLHYLPEDSFYLSFIVKMVIIFSLKPIDSAIEHFLLKRIIKSRKTVLPVGETLA